VSTLHRAVPRQRAGAGAACPLSRSKTLFYFHFYDNWKSYKTRTRMRETRWYGWGAFGGRRGWASVRLGLEWMKVEELTGITLRFGGVGLYKLNMVVKAHR
jgi:hypothetical protein